MAAGDGLQRAIIDEVVRASRDLAIPVKELSRSEVDNLRGRLSDLYGDGEHLLTFNNMRDSSHFYDEYGWRKLRMFLKPTEHVLFYDSPGYIDRAGALFADGAQIPDVIGECFGFVFYVTDSEHSFVVGMNDHDFLIGVGRAKAWIDSLLGNAGESGAG